MKITKDYNIFHVESDNVMVCSDLHIPFESSQMIEMMIDVAEQEKTTSLIINGDAWDMNPFSRHKKNTTWKILKKESLDTFKWLNTQFKHIVISMGNHDEWFIEHSNHNFDVSDIIDLTIDKNVCVDITPYDWITLNGQWRISHSCCYSQLHFKTPKKLGKKYRKNCINGHDHMLGIYTEIINNQEKFYINGGCMCEMSEMEYERSKTTTYGIWGNGFIHIRDNVPILHTPHKISESIIRLDVIDDVENGYTSHKYERDDI